jgi:hypothetical protein
MALPWVKHSLSLHDSLISEPFKCNNSTASQSLFWYCQRHIDYVTSTRYPRLCIGYISVRRSRDLPIKFKSRSQTRIKGGGGCPGRRQEDKTRKKTAKTKKKKKKRKQRQKERILPKFGFVCDFIPGKGASCQNFSNNEQKYISIIFFLFSGIGTCKMFKIFVNASEKRCLS